ncbi:hypothetical protein SARC_03496 [Sphaeroforma arctica JP610]|uniref:Uncharacterized protein n=1 Tax=Sphaeroforma arctica JP610 TaxID=667725 RepID=A0A0L0G5P3_9EUKA|nr:hypothetical protein SARC_03496 [Sphaeroforma arctica JP610]KNC84269.1 hypothetical protein SARC_03496 [Sphaeroforma arctica JP610]|eukprot:XP_014158171.1 hypothetical protein SARC_03496 [Sphaeroforma arctica JP610]
MKPEILIVFDLEKSQVKYCPSDILVSESAGLFETVKASEEFKNRFGRVVAQLDAAFWWRQIHLGIKFGMQLGGVNIKIV